MEDLILMRVHGVSFKDLYDWSVHVEKCKVTKVLVVTSPRKNGLNSIKEGKEEQGNLVKTNEQEIALFRFKEKVFAVKEFCPHAGGPLHLGDIEDIGDNMLSVKCPWHGWKIDLQTGKVIHPKGHDLHSTIVYPVEVNDNGDIFIGFNGLDPSYFNIERSNF